MPELHLDLSEYATRQSILDQVNAQLGPQHAAEVAARAAGAGVPDVMHHHPADVFATLDALAVSDAVKFHAKAIYELLTHAEATVHEKPIDQVHFHEVGRGAGIQNVVAICLALEALAPVRITATPVQAGSGTLHCAHGEMPCPAPATAVILDSGVPTCETRLEGERCTPTSAAIIKHYVQAFDEPGAARTYFQGPVPEQPHGHGHEHGHGEHHH
ncbi:MAG: DUF111 family protein [Coriobacteriia bacterium]|nr:DUF111 family protein [Coriobacteriia bacterium]